MIRRKFGPAVSGLLSAMKHPAVATQYALGLLAILAGMVLHLSYYEWIAFIFCIGIVITAEYFNTAIESLCDCVTREHNEAIGRVKDIAAGGVLTASITALVTAVVILLHHLF